MMTFKPAKSTPSLIFLNQAGTINLEDETISILYQKYIFTCTSGLTAYSFIQSLMRRAKEDTTSLMPMPPNIHEVDQYGVKMARYYLSMNAMGLLFPECAKSLFSQNAPRA